MRRILPILFLSLFTHALTFGQKDCRNLEYQNKLLVTHPAMIKRLNDIEKFTQNHIGPRRTAVTSLDNSPALPDVIVIPVVVHIVYNTDNQNVSDGQVLSQLQALTRDYRNLNNDRNNIPSYFSSTVADCGFEFRLAAVDPDGNTTSGIVRIQTAVTSFDVDDNVKFTSKGGDDAWDATKYLNIWVCNLSKNVVGYSSVIGCDPQIDGVVLHKNAFGISSSNYADFNLGRTATHEIGHWLNLRHIWGDDSCGDDQVGDTPQQQSAHRGCPSGRLFTCGNAENGDMYMNYMDLTNDACMYMFTKGQRQRMRALFLSDGPRYSILAANTPTYSLPQQAPLPDNAAVIQLYPNPATSSVTLQLHEMQLGEGRSFVIYNQFGQAVQTFTVTTTIAKIDISRLMTGIYYVRSKDGADKLVAKFVKVQ